MRTYDDRGQQGARDRDKPLSIPKAAKPLPHCAFCGRPVTAESHEKYARYSYCSVECHKMARRTNAAENRKKRVLRGVVSPIPVSEGETQHCWKCGTDKPVSEFRLDRSRVSGKTNICNVCQKEKNRDYYMKRKEERKKALKEINRQARRKDLSWLPPLKELSPRRADRALENLNAVLSALPEDAPHVLLASLLSGKINGAVFEDKGGCGCLWGTLGRHYKWSVAEEGTWAKRFRGHSCAEIELFGRVFAGDTPSNNVYARLIETQIKRFMSQQKGRKDHGNEEE